MEAIIVRHAHSSVKDELKGIINHQRRLTVVIILDIKLNILVAMSCRVEGLVDVYVRFICGRLVADNLNLFK